MLFCYHKDRNAVGALVVAGARPDVGVRTGWIGADEQSAAASLEVLSDVTAFVLVIVNQSSCTGLKNAPINEQTA